MRSPSHCLRHLVAVIALVAALASMGALASRAQGGDPDERGAESAEGAYEVEVDCTYDAGADRTTCAFQGVAGPDAKDVSHVDVPEAAVCAEVVGGDYEYVAPDPNTGVTGFKSKGSRGTLTLVLAGEVTVEGTATYAIKSGDGTFQVEGPGLTCDGPDQAAGVDTERATLRLVTFHCPTDGKSQTVFEAVAAAPVDDADDADVGIDLDGASVDVLEDEACIRAADVGFSVTDAEGEVVVRAATNGLGEAEVALLPATYTLQEGVLEASTEVSLTTAEPVVVAVVILGAVPLETEPEGAATVEVTVADIEVDEGTPAAAPTPTAPAENSALGEVTDSTGTIVVHKNACDFPAPTAEVEWTEVCPESAESATFRLTAVETGPSVPPSLGTTVNGSLSFDRLPPGRYHVVEVESRWCHAESDSVDAQGQVIVEAGQRSTVWVFNCTESA